MKLSYEFYVLQNFTPVLNTSVQQVKRVFLLHYPYWPIPLTFLDVLVSNLTWEVLKKFFLLLGCVGKNKFFFFVLFLDRERFLVNSGLQRMLSFTFICLLYLLMWSFHVQVYIKLKDVDTHATTIINNISL